MSNLEIGARFNYYIDEYNNLLFCINNRDDSKGVRIIFIQ